MSGVQGALAKCSTMYYIAMVVVLVSAVITYIEDYAITYDEIISAVCDATNFFGLAYICQVSASKFEGALEDKRAEKVQGNA